MVSILLCPIALRAGRRRRCAATRSFGLRPIALRAGRRRRGGCFSGRRAGQISVGRPVWRATRAEAGNSCAGGACKIGRFPVGRFRPFPRRRFARFSPGFVTPAMSARFFGPAPRTAGDFTDHKEAAMRPIDEMLCAAQGRTRFHMPGHKGRLGELPLRPGHDRACKYGRSLRPLLRRRRGRACWPGRRGRARPSSCPAVRRRACWRWCWPSCGRGAGC